MKASKKGKIAQQSYTGPEHVRPADFSKELGNAKFELSNAFSH